LYDSFYVDKSGGSSSVSVQYERTGSIGLSYDNGNSSNQNPCWNCGITGHAVADCVLPRNHERIQDNRRSHNLERSFENPRSRYYVDEDSSEISSKNRPPIPQFCPPQHLKPGILSPSLRYALGIRSSEHPPYYRNMYLTGYPPGYITWHPGDVQKSNPQYSVFFPGLFPGEIPALPSNISPIKKEKKKKRKNVQSDITEVDMELEEKIINPIKKESSLDNGNHKIFPGLDLNMVPPLGQSTSPLIKSISEQNEKKTNTENKSVLLDTEITPTNWLSSIKHILGNNSRKKRRVSKSSSETPQ